MIASPSGNRSSCNRCDRSKVSCVSDNHHGCVFKTSCGNFRCIKCTKDITSFDFIAFELLLIKSFTVHWYCINPNVDQDFSTISCFQTVSVTRCYNGYQHQLVRRQRQLVWWQFCPIAPLWEDRIIHIRQSNSLTNDRRDTCLSWRDAGLPSCFFFSFCFLSSAGTDEASSS